MENTYSRPSVINCWDWKSTIHRVLVNILRFSYSFKWRGRYQMMISKYTWESSSSFFHLHTKQKFVDQSGIINMKVKHKYIFEFWPFHSTHIHWKNMNKVKKDVIFPSKSLPKHIYIIYRGSTHTYKLASLLPIPIMCFLFIFLQPLGLWLYLCRSRMLNFKSTIYIYI